MSDTEFSFTIQGDSEGYVIFECPFCGSEFKLAAGEFQNSEQPIKELFCPYCGLAREKNAFLSKEIIEKAKALAYNYAVEELNKAFGNLQKSFSKSSSMIKITYKPLKKVSIKELNTFDTTEEMFECGACKNHVKVLYASGQSKVFCPYCGVDI